MRTVLSHEWFQRRASLMQSYQRTIRLPHTATALVHYTDDCCLCACLLLRSRINNGYKVPFSPCIYVCVLAPRDKPGRPPSLVRNRESLPNHRTAAELNSLHLDDITHVPLYLHKPFFELIFDKNDKE